MTLGTHRSRSSSPSSPDSLSDSLLNDFSSFNTWDPAVQLSPDSDSLSWHNVFNQAMEPKAPQDLLRLDDMLQDTSFDQFVKELPTSVNPAVFQLSQTQVISPTTSDRKLSMSTSYSSDALVSTPAMAPWPTPAGSPSTRVIPPPPVQPQRTDAYNSTNRVVFPPKDACYNLSILTPTIPPTGTKSRVETQVRVQIDLAYASCSSGDPYKYDRVGSWKWLRLPQGTATRKRSRKEGKIDASPSDTIYLFAEVTCSSSPGTRVVSCSTCRGREAKRVARKIAARIRPARSDSDNECSSKKEADESDSVIQFNCPDTLDFSTGSVVLPLRITCYCRHHREKVGFIVHFTMQDENGRVVGKGVTPPIMITDDHKSTGVNAKHAQQQQPQAMVPVPQALQETADWDGQPIIAGNGPTVTGRRRQNTRDSTCQSRRRAKPYDTSRPLNGAATSGNPSRESSYTDLEAVAGAFNEINMMSQFNSATPSLYSVTAPPSPKTQDLETTFSLPSPPQSYESPTTSHTGTMFDSNDVMMFEQGMSAVPNMLPPSPPQSIPSSPPVSDPLAIAASAAVMSAGIQPMMTFFGQPPDPPMHPSPLPKIHRLIPSSGPTFGGIEITVLGANFQPSMQYKCVFGESVANDTTRWSDNTLVCTLPPRACSGTVNVSLEGIKSDEEGTPAAFFTYVDESDRALMELALQVVGLKMTGKIEDAKNVALRIVGNTAQDTNNNNSVEFTEFMNVAASAEPIDYRRLLLTGATGGSFERLILDFLSLLDTPIDSENAQSLSASVSLRTSSGQTLLHLASFLNFPDLVEFLIDHEIDIDAQDRSGCTALHFSCLARSVACAGTLLNAGADASIVDIRGRSPRDISSFDFLLSLQQEAAAGVAVSDIEDEAGWGDGEEDSEDERLVIWRMSSASSLRRRRRGTQRSWTGTPAALSDAEDEEVPSAEQLLDDDDGATVVNPDSPKPTETETMDEKQAVATYVELLQRAWANTHLMPQMPALPQWQFPQLRGVTAFPIFVPMPARPAALTTDEERSADIKSEKTSGDADTWFPSTEWRASWEKFIAQMTAAAAVQNQESGVATEKKLTTPATASKDNSEASGTLTSGPQLEEPDHTTLTQEDGEEVLVEERPLKPASSRSLLRRFGYGTVPVAEQEVKTYTYRPERALKQKKDDRMLYLFWIPILILGMGWALYTAIPLLIENVEHVLPLRRDLGVFARL